MLATTLTGVTRMDSWITKHSKCGGIADGVIPGNIWQFHCICGEDFSLPLFNVRDVLAGAGVILSRGRDFGSVAEPWGNYGKP